MKRNTTPICLAAAFGLALLFPAVRAQASVYHVQGESAHAYFTGVDAAGCVYTSVDLNAFENRSQQPPGPPQHGSWASLYIYQFDYCRSVTLLNAEGEVQLAAEALTVSGGLHSARLTTGFPMYDYASGGPVQAFLDLTWTGSGELSQGGSRSSYSAPQYSSKGRYSGSSRQAEVSGTVQVGGANVELGADRWANLQSNQSGTMARSR